MEKNNNIKEDEILVEVEEIFEQIHNNLNDIKRIIKKTYR